VNNFYVAFVFDQCVLPHFPDVQNVSDLIEASIPEDLRPISKHGFYGRLINIYCSW